MCFDSSGEATELEHLPLGMSYIGLSGSSKNILGVGGVREMLPQPFASLFDLATFKWSSLAPLNSARQNGGACLLPSLCAFCFSGYSLEKREESSLQRLQTGTEPKWKTL